MNWTTAERAGLKRGSPGEEGGGSRGFGAGPGLGAARGFGAAPGAGSARCSAQPGPLAGSGARRAALRARGGRAAAPPPLSGGRAGRGRG